MMVVVSLVQSGTHKRGGVVLGDGDGGLIGVARQAAKVVE